MKKLILSGLLFLSGLSVGQEKQSDVVINKNQDKEVSRKMLDIYKQVKTSDDDPRYEIEFSQDACGYEILINDVPVHRYLLSGSANEQRIPINDHILLSGKQEITIRLFPPMLSDGSWSSTLVDESKFKIKVIHRQNNGPLEENQSVFEFNTVNQPGTEKFQASGQKVFEFKGVFNAKVPYQLEGWRHSKDLSKENQDLLLKEAVAAYNNFRNILIKKDTKAYASLMYDKEVELAKAFYWNKPSDSEERWNEMRRNIIGKREILPLKGFKMILYAGGKIVALQPTDEMYKDYLSAIHARTPDEDIQVSFLLHKKAGSNELTPIR
ncbi:hypothetical protein [Chryseobacterium sp.]|uniref:hypothetical protein n=1 Tax=Chryseobacterium sp. TaxID=1871047 RepID=UPI000ED42E63|nr:hypothetical protein [Chryseobacterium sp.]HCA10043.1 hypothetical protein [Chryseobacterium sp.]